MIGRGYDFFVFLWSTPGTYSSDTYDVYVSDWKDRTIELLIKSIAVMTINGFGPNLIIVGYSI